MSTTNTIFRSDDVLVLLGAGSSVEADIPHSAAMVSEIEKDITEGPWAEFRDVYNYVRSAIFFGDGIRGSFSGASYNIEKLVNTLDELCRREEHPLYPFIGAWHPRLMQVAGDNFKAVTTLKEKILDRLKGWIEISDYSKADYFQGLDRFQKELNYPLRVFTLNYDLCVERSYQAIHNRFPERGFGKDRIWSHQNLEASEGEESSIVLYKLHGSIDWQRDDKTHRLTYSDSTSKIKTVENALIFGTSYKLQYVDPFLFLVYELRRLSLQAKLIVVIGYGFADEHINGILRQALADQPDKRLVVVTWLGDVGPDEQERRTGEFRSKVEEQLKLPSSDTRLAIKVCKAKDFLEKELTVNNMAAHFPQQEQIFEEITSFPAQTTFAAE